MRNPTNTTCYIVLFRTYNNPSNFNKFRSTLYQKENTTLLYNGCASMTSLARITTSLSIRNQPPNERYNLSQKKTQPPQA
jgi:hypothetical protein